MTTTVSLDQLFLNARSQRAFTDKPIADGLLEKIYDLCKFGPTSMNCSPARFVFCTSSEAKAKLAECAMEGNKERILTAPASVIIAWDSNYFELLPELAPHMSGAKERFEKNPDMAQENGFRNATLQGGYFMLAARVFGLDCAPMSGFDQAAVDKSFFTGTSYQSNWICPVGYGDHDKLHKRAERLSFERACEVL